MPLERRARLVLVDAAGHVLGALPPIAVDVPWWQEAEAVVRAARELHRADVTVLRLLEVEDRVRDITGGGLITYLAEVTEPPDGLEPWSGELPDHPLRLPWAYPGGPAADLAWADRALRDAGLERTGPATQIRTWNLSSLWRLPIGVENAWLKHVPPFFAHEGAMLEQLAGGTVPRLIARDGARVLLHEIPGVDLYDADRPVLERLVDLLVAIQRDWIGREEDLLALGLPDWRPPALTAAVERAVARTAAELTDEDRRTLDRFTASLPDRFAAIAAAGLPDTLVHGDFHAGNARGDGSSLTLLDWGDCGVGHPLLDEAAFLDRMDSSHVDPVRERWHAAWRAAAPSSDPDQASRLIRPVAAARQAIVYWTFLDGIEPAEHPYHAPDPADWLGRTAALVRAEG